MVSIWMATEMSKSWTVFIPAFPQSSLPGSAKSRHCWAGLYALTPRKCVCTIAYLCNHARFHWLSNRYGVLNILWFKSSVMQLWQVDRSSDIANSWFVLCIASKQVVVASRGDVETSWQVRTSDACGCDCHSWGGAFYNNQSPTQIICFIQTNQLAFSLALLQENCLVWTIL